MGESGLFNNSFIMNTLCLFALNSKRNTELFSKYKNLEKQILNQNEVNKETLSEFAEVAMQCNEVTTNLIQALTDCCWAIFFKDDKAPKKIDRILSDMANDDDLDWITASEK